MPSGCLTCKRFRGSNEEQPLKQTHFNMRIRLKTDEVHTVRRGHYGSLELVFSLKNQPTHFRTFKYTWEKADRPHISSMLSPKIMRFADGTYLMANRCWGTWLYEPERPLELRWILLGKEVQPFFLYEADSKRDWVEVGCELDSDMDFKLIRTERPIEVSFSRIPFSPVMVFTDHCDFDSDVLLTAQRDLFKRAGVRVTKGVFIRKYSHKGDWNSAYEGNEEEFSSWVGDGHELCYHALSQSILPNEGEQNELYRVFNAPVADEGQFRTWIDHGYQTYNTTKSADKIEHGRRLEHLSSKGVRNIWNYHDVAEVIDTLNQLDYNQMEPKRIFKSRTLGWADRVRIAFFFNTTEADLLKYRGMAGLLKKRRILHALQALPGIVGPLIRSIRNLSISRKVRNAQSVFPSEHPGITAFQSIIVKDFKRSLGKPYERLKEECGLAILHTYFSFLGSHHGVTLFQSADGRVTNEIEKSFKTIGEDVRNGLIWNPTLHEFMEYCREISRFDFENAGEGLHQRRVEFKA